MAVIWDANEVLGIFAFDTILACSGINKTDNKRCTNRCDKDHRREAQRILRKMSTIDPMSPRIALYLSQLPDWTLCKRWHLDKPGNSQRIQVQQRWQMKIDAYNVAMAVQMANHRSSSSSSTVSSGTIYSTSSSSSSSSPDSTPPSTPSRSPRFSAVSRRSAATISDLTLDRLSHLNVNSISSNSTSRSSDDARRTPFRSSTSSTATHHPRSSVQLSVTSPATSISEPSAPRQRQDTLPRAALPTPRSSPPRTTSLDISTQQQELFENFMLFLQSSDSILSTSIPSPPQSPEPEAGATRAAPPASTSTASSPTPAGIAGDRVTRKPIAEPCPICLEEINSPDDALWCRATCGNNVHRSCFGQWRGECIERFRAHDMIRDDEMRSAEIETAERERKAVTCVWCRSSWKNEFE